MEIVRSGNHGDAGLTTMILRVSTGDGVASLLAFFVMFLRLSVICASEVSSSIRHLLGILRGQWCPEIR